MMILVRTTRSSSRCRSTSLVDEHAKRELAHTSRQTFGVVVRVRVARGHANRSQIEIERRGTLDQVEIDEIEREAHHFVLERQARIAAIDKHRLKLIVVLDEQQDERFDAVHDLFGVHGRQRAGELAQQDLEQPGVLERVGLQA